MTERVSRFLERFGTAVVLLIAAFAIAVVLSNCGGEGPTEPQTVPVPENHIPANAGQVATTPTVASTPDPKAELSYVTLNTDGSGQWCVLAKGGQTAYITYTKPLDLTVVYGHFSQPGTLNECVAIPAAKETGVDFPWCGKQQVQVDVNQDGYLKGRHIGHVFATVEGDNGEWVEQPPKITYDEWSECKPDAQPSTAVAKCHQSRTKRTVIEEKNSCTGALRVKSEKTETETRECDCKCVPEWKELPPVITYTEWSACLPEDQIPAPNCEPKCYQFRYKTTVITEEEVCTKATREKSRTREQERKECPCPPPSCVSGKGSRTYCVPVLGNPTEELLWISTLGLGGPFGYLGKVDPAPTPWIAPADYPILVAKDGSCEMQNGDKGQEYRVYWGVKAGDVIQMESGKAISHVTLFGCERD